MICGASFGGLAVARELPDARVLILDRYEVGERQTSACAAPTEWMRNLGLEGSIKQTFERLVVHTPHGTSAWPLPFTFSTFDYRTLCELMDDQNGAEFETAKVNGRTGTTIHTDRGDVSAPLVVDALGWRRVLGSGDNYQPPDAPLSRGLEVHPHGSGQDLELWIDRSYVPAGYGWSFPAGDEMRIGVGSFDPGYHVKEPTVRLAEDLEQDAVRYQGNWIPHKLRRGTEDGIFFVGRLGRPLHPAHRGGHSHGVVLRHRAAAASCGASSRAGRAPRPRCAATGHSTTVTSGSSRACCSRRSSFRECRPACSGEWWRASRSRPSRAGPSANYLKIAHPSFAASPAPAPRPKRGLVAA